MKKINLPGHNLQKKPNINIHPNKIPSHDINKHNIKNNIIIIHKPFFKINKIIKKDLPNNNKKDKKHENIILEPNEKKKENNEPEKDIPIQTKLTDKEINDVAYQWPYLRKLLDNCILDFTSK